MKTLRSFTLRLGSSSFLVATHLWQRWVTRPQSCHDILLRLYLPVMTKHYTITLWHLSGQQSHGDKKEWPVFVSEISDVEMFRFGWKKYPPSNEIFDSLKQNKTSCYKTQRLWWNKKTDTILGNGLHKMSLFPLVLSNIWCFTSLLSYSP